MCGKVPERFPFARMIEASKLSGPIYEGSKEHKEASTRCTGGSEAVLVMVNF